MLTLENDCLTFRFPHLDKTERVAIDFQRTIRIPDTQKTYSLPPGLGSFPLRHVDDCAAKLSPSTIDRGGVLMPMWQSEALWLGFHGYRIPVAIKVAAGKVNAVTGEAWRPGLHRRPQDYMVSPIQPWLDGFAVEKGVIRQFVAMPLGDGYTAEEQLTDKAEWGGIQISVTPLTASAWAKHQTKQNVEGSGISFSCDMPTPMGLAAGGRMKQSIGRDPFRLTDWDVEATERVFVSIIHGKDWAAVTGEPVHGTPPTASEYAAHGLPWFDYYGADQSALKGSKALNSMKSVGAAYDAKTGSLFPDSEDVVTGPVIKLSPHS